MTIVNGAPSIVNKFRYSLSDALRVVIYDHHMFIVQATGLIFTVNARNSMAEGCLRASLDQALVFSI